jgi:hypothetical protein
LPSLAKITRVIMHGAWTIIILENGSSDMGEIDGMDEKGT